MKAFFRAWRERISGISAANRHDIFLGLSGLLSPAVLFVNNLVATRWLLPAELGTVQTVMLWGTYFSFLQLGVFNGLGRDLAFNIGQKRDARAVDLVSASWRMVRLLGWISFPISLFFLAKYYFEGRSVLHLAALATLWATLWSEPRFTHLDVVYRSARETLKAARLLCWQNGISLVAGCFPIMFGALGFVASRCVQSLSRIALLSPGVPIKPRPTAPVREVVELARSGAPLMLASVVFSYFGVADRSIVAYMMSETEVGQLTLSNLVISAIQIVPLSVGAILYPRIVADYGRLGSSRCLRRWIWIAGALNAAIVVPVAILAYLLVGPFTHAFLPRYADGIAAARIASLGSIGFCYFAVTGIIAAVKRNTPFLAGMVFALLMVWVLGVWSVTMGYGIEGVAMARAVGTTLLFLFTFGYAYYLTTQDISAGT